MCRCISGPDLLARSDPQERDCHAAFVRPDGLPPVSGYSHAVAVSWRLVVISGQVPADGTGRLVGPGDPAAQVRQVFENLKAALAAAGATMEQVVKLTVYLADLVAFRQVRDEYISPDRPRPVPWCKSAAWPTRSSGSRSRL